jgi:hypothetical protein
MDSALVRESPAMNGLNTVDDGTAITEGGNEKGKREWKRGTQPTTTGMMGATMDQGSQRN